MIKLTKIDGAMIVLNAEEIESVETSHDSTITLIGGRKIVVKETADEIIRLVIAFKQKCNCREIQINMPDDAR